MSRDCEEATKPKDECLEVAEMNTQRIPFTIAPQERPNGSHNHVAREETTNIRKR